MDKDSLKKMIEDMISGKNESAQTHFHSYIQDKMKSYLEPSDEPVQESAPSAGMSKKEKSSAVKQAKSGKDMGKKGKNFEQIANKAAKKYGSKEKGDKVAGAVFWKKMKKG